MVEELKEQLGKYWNIGELAWESLGSADATMARVAIMHAESVGDLGSALKCYALMHYKEHRSWPAISELQQNYNRTFSRLFGSGSSLLAVATVSTLHPELGLKAIKEGKATYLVCEDLKAREALLDGPKMDLEGCKKLMKDELLAFRAITNPDNTALYAVRDSMRDWIENNSDSVEKFNKAQVLGFAHEIIKQVASEQYIDVSYLDEDA